jgi:hypothetical protein
MKALSPDFPTGVCKVEMEGPVGFEPTTRGLKGRCSNLLSYGPINMGVCHIILSLLERKKSTV